VTLHVGTFGGGIVLEGSSDAQRTDELAACDSYDIGPRGQLIVASDLTSSGSLVAQTHVAGMRAIAHPVVATADTIVVGDNGTNLYVDFAVIGAASLASTMIAAVLAEKCIVTMASMPAVIAGAQSYVTLVAIAARAFRDPNVAPGLYVVINGSSMAAISTYSSLGLGTARKQLYPRGVFTYNGHAFIFGFDNNSTDNSGPTRVMFSNIFDPTTWGNDTNPGGGVNRAFADSDAIALAGEAMAIRAGYVWAGKAWLGTNRGLHYIEGYGRESFTSNGAVTVRSTKNVIGQNAMIEGPDGLLYGIGDEGLWSFDGRDTEPLYRKLRDFNGKSIGYWDLIWTIPTISNTYPGPTNQDLVWMVSDVENMQVWIVIPYCDATAGYGAGTDTVIIKYHTQTGGFTRQVFTGLKLTSGMFTRREPGSAPQRCVGVVSGSNPIMRYGYKSTATTAAALPTALPTVTLGEYALYGPDGVGVYKSGELTLRWEAVGSLPLVFTATPTVDGEAGTATTITIKSTAPGSPANGDVWVDTSGTDTNIGNGTAGTLVPAHAADYLVKRWVTGWSKWVVMGGGQQGTRVTIPIAWIPMRGTRLSLALACTTLTGRYQLEGVGFLPKPIRAAL
jgi:hypothetical protein